MRVGMQDNFGGVIPNAYHHLEASFLFPSSSNYFIFQVVVCLTLSNSLWSKRRRRMERREEKKKKRREEKKRRGQTKRWTDRQIDRPAVERADQLAGKRCELEDRQMDR